MSLERGKVVVFGSGPAGLAAGYELAKRGVAVDLITRKKDTTVRSVYSTHGGVGMSQVERHLKPKRRKDLGHVRVLTSGGADFSVVSRGKFFMVDNQGFVDDMRKEAEGVGVNIARLGQNDLRGIGIWENGRGVGVEVMSNYERYDYVLDCSGVEARFAKQVEPNRRNETFFGECVYGARFRGGMDRDDMVLAIGPAGGTSWANPSFEAGYIDVLYTAYGPVGRGMDKGFWKTANKRLKTLVDFLRTKSGIHFESDVPEDVYMGVIRNQPCPKPSSKSVFSVGEAAGMARPGTSDSWRRALGGGQMAAEAILNGDTAGEFYDKWTREWRDLILRAAAMERSLRQNENDLGLILNQADRWMRTGELSATLTAEFERWMVEEKMSLGLLTKCLTSPATCIALMRVMLKAVEVGVMGEAKAAPRSWNLQAV